MLKKPRLRIQQTSQIRFCLAYYHSQTAQLLYASQSLSPNAHAPFAMHHAPIPMLNTHVVKAHSLSIHPAVDFV